MLERANFDLWGDVTSTENRVPSPVTSCHLLGVPLPSPSEVTSFMDGPKVKNHFSCHSNNTQKCIHLWNTAIE